MEPNWNLKSFVVNPRLLLLREALRNMGKQGDMRKREPEWRVENVYRISNIFYNGQDALKLDGIHKYLQRISQYEEQGVHFL